MQLDLCPGDMLLNQTLLKRLSGASWGIREETSLSLSYIDFFSHPHLQAIARSDP